MILSGRIEAYIVGLGRPLWTTYLTHSSHTFIHSINTALRIPKAYFDMASLLLGESQSCPGPVDYHSSQGQDIVQQV